MTADRWTIRGVPNDLQRAVSDAARQEGRSVGAWVSNALRAALSGQRPEHGPADTELRTTVEQLAGRLTAMESRLDEMLHQLADHGRGLAEADCPAGGGQMADRPADGDVSTAGDTGGGDAVPGSRRSALAESVIAARTARGWTTRDLARNAGVPQSEVSKLENDKLRGTARSGEHVSKVLVALGLER